MCVYVSELRDKQKHNRCHVSKQQQLIRHSAWFVLTRIATSAHQKHAIISDLTECSCGEIQSTLETLHLLTSSKLSKNPLNPSRKWNNQRHCLISTDHVRSSKCQQNFVTVLIPSELRINRLFFGSKSQKKCGKKRIKLRSLLPTDCSTLRVL